MAGLSLVTGVPPKLTAAGLALQVGGVRLRLMKVAFPLSGSSLLALALLSFTLPAHAQDEDEFVSTGGVLPAGMVQSLEPADRLAMNLRLLSQNPRDVNALTQAGISAVEVGDPNAAVGFLARAEALSPSNGRVKAALGSALIQLEKPVEALRFFNDAVAFGVPERDVWKDRGLAYDLSGDPKRAQRDYELVLRAGQDAETTRRLALSLGANGEKEPALKLLEPLVRRNDQAAWRARAFVLAMSGDIRGAERIVEQVMPSGSLSPFLRRLPSLSAADRARAVNFGTMPADNRYYASAAPVGPARPISSAASTALASVQPPAVAQRFEGSSNDRSRKAEKRRRPGKEQQVALAAPQPLARPAQGPVAPAPVRNSAPGFSAEASRTAPTEVADLPDRRVGKRIGPVDVERLPEVMKPGAPEQKWVQVAGNSLPPPTSAAPLVRPPTPAVVGPVPKVEAPAPAGAPTPRFESAPAPVFEVASVPVVTAPPAVVPSLAPAPQPVAASASIPPSPVRVVEALTILAPASPTPVAVAAVVPPEASIAPPAVVTPAIVTPAVYPVPVYYGRGFRHHRHGVTRIEYERDGDIEIRHRY